MRVLVKRALILAALPILLLTGPASSLPSTSDRSVVLRQAAGEQEEEADDAGGIHGGTVERVHQGCTFPDGLEAPAGNWTHGDYVSAVAADGIPVQVREAAQSDCGKPMVAVGYGGPPPHALEHMATGQAHAGGGSLST
jgi:hypothetical protein